MFKTNLKNIASLICIQQHILSLTGGKGGLLKGQLVRQGFNRQEVLAGGKSTQKDARLQEPIQEIQVNYIIQS